MKSILLIGLGRFGKNIAIHLNKLGHQVMAVDDEEERVENVLPYVTNAQIGDSTNKDFLESLGIRNFDVCIVAIGNDFQSSLETTSLLKELGARLVVSRASTDVHEKFLLRNGADEVIYPDRDMAERVAKKYSANHVLDYVALNDNYSIYEINPPEGWVGKSIMENNVRQKYNVNIVTVKEAGKNRVLPLPDYVFKADDAVMVFGLNADVDKLVRKL